MTFRNNAVRFTSETSNPRPRKRSAPSKTRTPFLCPLLLVSFDFQGRLSMGFETQDAKRRPAGDEILTPSETPAGCLSNRGFRALRGFPTRLSPILGNHSEYCGKSSVSRSFPMTNAPKLPQTNRQPSCIRVYFFSPL